MGWSLMKKYGLYSLSKSEVIAEIEPFDTEFTQEPLFRMENEEVFFLFSIILLYPFDIFLISDLIFV